MRPLATPAATAASTSIRSRSACGWGGRACAATNRPTAAITAALKALHHYAREHYPSWLAELGERAVLRAPGAFGENLSTRGLTENEVCVGDIYRAGTALLQVSLARQPCWKLDHRFDTRGMAARVQASGKTGWYYRVLEEGWLRAGDALCLQERPQAQWPLARVQDILNRRVLSRAVLRALSELPEAVAELARALRKTGRSGEAEDWTRRLKATPSHQLPRVLSMRRTLEGPGHLALARALSGAALAMLAFAPGRGRSRPASRSCAAPR